MTWSGISVDKLGRLIAENRPDNERPSFNIDIILQFVCLSVCPSPSPSPSLSLLFVFEQKEKSVWGKKKLKFFAASLVKNSLVLPLRHKRQIPGEIIKLKGNARFESFDEKGAK
jgi:hypothetical protein